MVLTIMLDFHVKKSNITMFIEDACDAGMFSDSELFRALIPDIHNGKYVD